MSETIIITEQEWDEFSILVGEIGERAGVLSKASAGAAVAVQHNAGLGNLDGALAFGAATMEAMAGERDAMMERFEIAAARISGEPRKPGETGIDYFHRICSIDLLAAMQRNRRFLRIGG